MNWTLLCVDLLARLKSYRSKGLQGHYSETADCEFRISSVCRLACDLKNPLTEISHPRPASIRLSGKEKAYIIFRSLRCNFPGSHYVNAAIYETPIAAVASRIASWPKSQGWNSGSALYDNTLTYQYMVLSSTGTSALTIWSEIPWHLDLYHCMPA